ncbi:MAG UNVERIFIED_CONTAM: bifunctional adenosylcobinamide kinase/adenosylcobinamide-phosphate guanylyltransferase [Anaerolineae bacterium]|jgi:adenosylcobinamide kinase/adenosylcobinamide-phosphate guanylyltransferase
MGRLILLLGGARSGKSTYAEQWAKTNGGNVLFVATAQAFDEEMTTRIDLHRASRPAEWHTLEIPQHLARALATQSHAVDTVIVDCMTLWVTNILLSFDDHAMEASIHAETETQLTELLGTLPTILPLGCWSRTRWAWVWCLPHASGRYFRDALGFANQRVASHADEVSLAGGRVAVAVEVEWHAKSPGNPH